MTNEQNNPNCIYNNGECTEDCNEECTIGMTTKKNQDNDLTNNQINNSIDTLNPNIINTKGEIYEEW